MSPMFLSLLESLFVNASFVFDDDVVDTDDDRFSPLSDVNDDGNADIRFRRCRLLFPFSLPTLVFASLLIPFSLSLSISSSLDVVDEEDRFLVRFFAAAAENEEGNDVSDEEEGISLLLLLESCTTFFSKEEGMDDDDEVVVDAIREMMLLLLFSFFNNADGVNFSNGTYCREEECSSFASFLIATRSSSSSLLPFFFLVSLRSSPLSILIFAIGVKSFRIFSF